MFRISADPIEPDPLSLGLSAGALVAFQGVVRNHNEGQTVKALQYEAMEELACKEGNRILSEAMERFAIEDATCIHRVGLLRVGEIAILVQVSAAHREAAFDGCRFIVDEVKARVPIWKKEFYESGETGWINAGPLPEG